MCWKLLEKANAKRPKLAWKVRKENELYLSVKSSSAEAESKTLGKVFTNMDLLTGE